MYLRTTLQISLTAALLGASALVYAGGDHGDHVRSGQPVTGKANMTHAALTEGEIKKIDKDAQKLTIKHGEIKNLGMPAMTMVFQVQDKSMLDQVAKGDKVGFMADKVEGKFVITRLLPTQEKH